MKPLNFIWKSIKAVWRFTGKVIRWYKGLFIKSPWWKKTLGTIGSLIVLFFLYLGAVDVNLFWLFGKSPGFFDIMNPQTASASELYTADGVMIGKYFSENRTPVSYDDVNPVFWDALISTEDERYYSHHGVDIEGVFGALKDAVTGRGERGASTITQQLAKNMFRVRTQYSTGLSGKIPGVKLLVMKTKEWIIATKLEICHDKKAILTMYANTVDFGSNAFGIKTACKTYFNCSPKDLRPEQAAVLVGMLKATTTYNPKTNPENSKKRRNQVLVNMRDHGHLTDEECDSLQKIDITLKYTVENNYDGQAMYFREAVAAELKDWCEDNGYDLYTSGLKIYTTVDSRLQKYAENAAMKQMKELQASFNNHWGNTKPWVDSQGRTLEGFIDGIIEKLPVYRNLAKKYDNNPDSINYYLNQKHNVKLFTWENDKHEKTEFMSTRDSVEYMVKFLHCSFIAMEPQTGQVKAYVGDVDFKTWKYDKVRAKRQPGSTFKLFVYTTAMNKHMTPCTSYIDQPVTIQSYDPSAGKEKPWTPHNADGYCTGARMPLKSAFARSINTIAVQIGQDVGIDNVIKTAHAMGIQSELVNAPALALGCSDVSLEELVNSYCTVANDGVHTEPLLVTKIIDNKGTVIYEASNTGEQVIPYKSAYFMQKMLMGGMREPGGTSQRLWGYVGNASDTEFGGKTGTSNNHSDAWFVGVSPKLVCGAWVGGEYRCIHFRTGALGQGSRTALPICGLFLQSVMNDPDFKQYHGKFNPLKDGIDVSDLDLNCASYVPEDTLTFDSLFQIDDFDLDELRAEPIIIENQQNDNDGGYTPQDDFTEEL